MTISIENIKFNEFYEDIDKLFNDLQNVAQKTKNIMYRGISRDNEKYPNLLRVRSQGKYVNMYRKEFDMLRQFRHEGASLLQNTYSTLDLICAAQHFGIPTRLIDWTTNPFVALFFSLSAFPSDEKEFKYRLYICDMNKQLVFEDMYSPTTVNQIELRASDARLEQYEGFINIIQEKVQSLTLPRLCDRANIKYSDKSLNRFIVLKAGNANPRINAQKGLFVIPRKINKQLIDKEYTAAQVKTITISPKIRRDALQRLDNLGYSRLHLFFDLQNLCQYIKETALDL